MNQKSNHVELKMKKEKGEKRISLGKPSHVISGSSLVQIILSEFGKTKSRYFGEFSSANYSLRAEIV